jgi:orotate phosphoribosyltransferase
MNYRSIADLSADVRRFARKDLPDVDLIVGIPRSGLLAANLLCLHLNVPMTDVDRLCENRLIDTGERYAEDPSLRDFDSVLVVDDYVRTRARMRETRGRLADRGWPFDLSYGGVYVSPRGREPAG